MTKEIQLLQVDGITFVGRGNTNHWVVLDGTNEFGGNLAGSSPKELLLIALAGCTANDVVPILRKKRSPVDKLEIRVTGTEREEHPKIFTHIHIEYIFRGNGIRTEDVERAIELSTTKYCSVSAMLAASAEITHSYKIEPLATT